VLVYVSSDPDMPRATVTDFDENRKYNPMEGAFTAIFFQATSPDPTRTCCQTNWEVDGGPILGKPGGAPSPMLVDLGRTRPNAVYRLKLTVTDGIGSTSSTVVSLTTNGPPASGTFAVAPYRGTALTTEFEFLLDGWSDDADDYPLTYTYSYRQQLSARGRGGGRFADRRTESAALTPLVADQYASSWFVTTLPQADNVNITCVGRVFDRYLSFAQAFAPARVDALKISTEDLSALAGDLLSASANTGDGEVSLSLVANVASVIGGTDRRRLSSEQDLVDDLMAHTISAAGLVGTGSSAAAASQVLATVATLTGDPDALSEASQVGALGLLHAVAGDAAGTGLDADAAASAVSAASSLLDASLFVGESDVELGEQLAGAVGSLATGLIAGAYGGQNRSVVTDNVELSAFRTDCGTRAAAFRLGSGVSTAVPAAALDAAGGGACDAASTRRRLQDGAPMDVDVTVARLKNVYASAGIVSDLVQIELGSGGTVITVEDLAEPIVFGLPFASSDPALDASYDPGARTGTCFNRSQVLHFDCGVPTTFDCGARRNVTLPDGSSMTFEAAPTTGASPALNVTVACPATRAACAFWADDSWSTAGCAVVAATSSEVTCACTHLTDFAAAVEVGDADFSVGFAPSPGPTSIPTAVRLSPSPAPAPTPAPTPGPTPLPGHPTAAPVVAPTPRPSLAPTAQPTTPAPSYGPTPAPSRAQTLVQVDSSVTLAGVDAAAFNADAGLQAAFAASILASAGGLFEEIINIVAAGRRRLDDGAGVAIAYTGVARVDGTANAEAVSADLLAQSMDALGAAVTDGSFLTTLQAADAAFAAVTVDEAATQAAIVAASVVFVVTTPAPSTAPAPRPTPAPSVAVASGAPGGGDDGSGATDGGTAAAAADSGGSDSDSGGLLVVIVMLLAVILVLLAGIVGYLAHERRGKVYAVGIGDAGALTTDRWALRRASPRVEPFVEAPQRADAAESARSRSPVRQDRLPPLNRGPSRPRTAPAPDDGGYRGPPRRAAPDF